jgi:hypothetical protein
MSRSLQLFIEKRLEEERLVEYLNRCIRSGVETTDIQVDEAEYFAQLQEYEEGFHSGLNISWRDDESLDLDEIHLAFSIAKEFNTTVLLEINDESCEWCLVDSEGAKHAVTILELDDGISVSQEAGRTLLG